MQQIIDFFSNFDARLDGATDALGHWAYIVFFLIIFAETGLVVMAFLPGDSLLFAIGAFCARPELDLRLWVIITSLTVASFIGNYTNFLIARAIGIKLGGEPGIQAAGLAIGKLYGGRFARFVKPTDMIRADKFFRKYGVLAICFARFVPFLRTLLPFVAGLSDMKTGPFLASSAIGGALWVGVCTLAGYWCGNIPWVRDNFTTFILVMFSAAFLPLIYRFVMKKLFGVKPKIEVSAGVSAGVSAAAPVESKAPKEPVLRDVKSPAAQSQPGRSVGSTKVP